MSGSPSTLTADQARRMAVAAQGLADPRPTGRVDRRHLRKVFDRIGVIQIDSVNVLVRSQELPLFARLGPHPRNLLADALDDGELFEYWAHMAAIVPSAHHPLFRWRMDAAASLAGRGPARPRPSDVHRRGLRADPPTRPADRRRPRAAGRAEGTVVGLGRRQDRARGAVPARAGRRPPAPERLRPALRPARACAAGGRAGGADADRGRGPQGAARHGGAGARRGDARGPRRLPPPGARRPAGPRRRARRGRSPAARRGRGVEPAGVRARRAPPCRGASDGRALLSPFDSLVWKRDRTERLFGFHYRIEIYTPPPKRVYGYYVLPFLLDGELVGRVDLKADRADGVLRVQGAYAELGVPLAEVGRELAEELHSMAGWLELDVVATTDRGELAPELARAGVAQSRPETPPEQPASVRSERGQASRRRHVEPTPDACQRRVRERTRQPIGTSRSRRLPAVGRPSRRRVLGRVPRRPRHPLLLGPAQRPVRAARRLGVPVARHRARRQPPRRRGWRRGTATALILFGVAAMFLVFVVAIGALVGTQIADLLPDSETYIRDTVNAINDTFGTNLNAQEVIDEFNDPNGRGAAVHPRPAGQRRRACRSPRSASCCSSSPSCCSPSTSSPTVRSCAAPSAAGSRRPARSASCATWELAGNKTGGYLYSRALLALLSAVFHWIVFQAVGTPAPVALALWVGIISQFLPVVGTYLAGVLPVLLAFLDSPLNAVIVLIAIVMYQQIENYLFSPRITARTMELHPALAFGAALAGAAVLGGVGAVLALPAAAMIQALSSEWGARHQVIKSDLTEVRHHRVFKRWTKIEESAPVSADAFVPIAVTERSGVVESIHHGAVVALDPDGAVAWSVGDPDVVMYPRSALKPLQAAAMVGGRARSSRTGCWPSSAPAMTGGRSTSPRVAAILAGAGLGPDDLENTRRCRSTRRPRRCRAGWCRAGIAPAELQREACRHACHGGHQRVADVRLLGRRSPRPAHDRRPPANDRRTRGSRRRRRVRGARSNRLVDRSCVRRPSPRRRWSSCPSGHDWSPEMVGGPTRDVTRLIGSSPGCWPRMAPKACRSWPSPTVGPSPSRSPTVVGARTPVTSPRCARSASTSPPTRRRAGPRPWPGGRVRPFARRRAVTGPEFATLDDVVYGRVDQVGADDPAGDRREPVEVHVPGHRHVHRRRGRGCGDRSGPGARLPS